MTAISIMGLISFLNNISISGKIIFEGQDILKQNEQVRSRMRGAQMSMIIQQPMETFDPVMKIGKQLAEAILIHNPKVLKDELNSRINQTLEVVGLFDTNQFLNAYPHELSGGQLQRIAIGMAIINNPKLLIADEPTSSLDQDLAKEVNELLVRLVKSRNMGLIYISHNISTIETICDSLLILENGKVIGKGCVSNDCKESNTQVIEYLNQKVFGNRNSIEIIGNTEKFRALDLSKSYPKSNFWGLHKTQFKVLSQISFAIKAGEMVGILGASGSGKTTLAKIVGGLTNTDEGSLYLNGDVYDRKLLESDKTARKKIQMILQNSSSSLQPKMTLEKQWKEVFEMYRGNDLPSYESIIKFWLRKTDLPESTLFKFPFQLSGGQQQRAALVRTLLSNPDLVIFDESLSALNVKNQNLMIKLITKLQDELKFAGLFITHDIELAKAICHQIYTMQDGKIIKNITL